MLNALRTDDMELETEVDQAIQDHGGDARVTVKALLVANAYLEAARDEALSMVSYGYIRKALKSQQRGGQ